MKQPVYKNIAQDGEELAQIGWFREDSDGIKSVYLFRKFKGESLKGAIFGQEKAEIEESEVIESINEMLLETPPIEDEPETIESIDEMLLETPPIEEGVETFDEAPIFEALRGED